MAASTELEFEIAERLTPKEPNSRARLSYFLALSVGLIALVGGCVLLTSQVELVTRALKITEMEANAALLIQSALDGQPFVYVDKADIFSEGDLVVFSDSEEEIQQVLKVYPNAGLIVFTRGLLYNHQKVSPVTRAPSTGDHLRKWKEAQEDLVQRFTMPVTQAIQASQGYALVAVDACDALKLGQEAELSDPTKGYYEFAKIIGSSTDRNTGTCRITFADLFNYSHPVNSELSVMVATTTVDNSFELAAKSELCPPGRDLTSTADCEAAASALKLEWGKTVYAPHNRRHCFFQETLGKVFFNTAFESDALESSDTSERSACRLEFSGIDDNMIYRVTTGSCKYPITTLEECGKAAGMLGIHDADARVDGLNASDLHPPYCYFDSSVNELMFNAGSNTRKWCGEDKKCLCATTPASCKDTAQRSLNAVGLDCSFYAMHEMNDCIHGGDADFSPQVMCCACGGGASLPTPAPAAVSSLEA